MPSLMPLALCSAPVNLLRKSFWPSGLGTEVPQIRPQCPACTQQQPLYQSLYRPNGSAFHHHHSDCCKPYHLVSATPSTGNKVPQSSLRSKQTVDGAKAVTVTRLALEKHYITHLDRPCRVKGVCKAFQAMNKRARDAIGRHEVGLGPWPRTSRRCEPTCLVHQSALESMNRKSPFLLPRPG